MPKLSGCGSAFSSHSAASFSNAQFPIRTVVHEGRVSRGCSCIRLLHTYGVAEGFQSSVLHLSNSRQCMSLNHLLVSCCSVVVDYEGITQCARFPKSTTAAQATSFCSLPQSE